MSLVPPTLLRVALPPSFNSRIIVRVRDRVRACSRPSGRGGARLRRSGSWGLDDNHRGLLIEHGVGGTTKPLVSGHARSRSRGRDRSGIATGSPAGPAAWRSDRAMRRRRMFSRRERFDPGLGLVVTMAASSVVDARLRPVVRDAQRGWGTVCRFRALERGVVAKSAVRKRSNLRHAEGERMRDLRCDDRGRAFRARAKLTVRRRPGELPLCKVSRWRRISWAVRRLEAYRPLCETRPLSDRPRFEL